MQSVAILLTLPRLAGWLAVVGLNLDTIMGKYLSSLVYCMYKANYGFQIFKSAALTQASAIKTQRF